MHVDKGGGLRWYKQLLQLSLAEPRNLNINPRNCVGTVLSLNGFRRYFCVFHVTLPGGTSKRHRSSGYRNGGFLGFDSDKGSDEDNSDVESRRPEPPALEHRPSVLFTSHLLDNLPNWLDRLFEGTTHRYHISDDWPEFSIV
jgi:DnaJ family protein C protein 16